MGIENSEKGAEKLDAESLFTYFDQKGIGGSWTFSPRSGDAWFIVKLNENEDSVTIYKSGLVKLEKYTGPKGKPIWATNKPEDYRVIAEFKIEDIGTSDPMTYLESVIEEKSPLK